MPDGASLRLPTRDLDLTAKGVLPPDLLQRLDALAITQVDPFNELVAGLGRGRERDIDWWVSRPANRNNFVSTLFHRCVQLHLIQDLLAEGHSLRLRVDNKAFASVIAQLPGVIVTAVSPANRISGQRAHDVISSLFHTAAAGAAAWVTRPSQRQKEEKNLLAVDVFVLRDSMQNGEFQDRYFPGLVDNLPKHMRDRLRYVPRFYRIRNYRAMFRQLRANPVPFLLIQDWLTCADYAFAFGHWWRLRKFRNLRAVYRDVDISALVRSDFASGRFAQSAIAALLCYRFWRKADLPVAQILSWYEGQGIDHALAAAVNWHGTPIRLTGFRPACSDLEMSVMPAAHEVAAGVVPPVMAITGQGFRDVISKALPGLRTTIAPGLRYTRLAALPRPASGDEKQILVVLPLAEETIAPLRDLIGDIPRRSARPWLIKPHPATPPGSIEKLFNDTSLFEIIRGDFYDWLPQSQLVLGLESSALLEAVAYGVPAICLAQGNIPTKIPFPNWLDGKRWRVCYSQQDLEESISLLSALNSTQEERQMLRSTLLSPADAVTVRRFAAEL